MGNSSVKEVPEDCRSLDISCRLDPLQYVKHTSGDFIEGCLLALPWEMYYNTVSLYEKVNASFNFISEIPEELSLHVPHLRYLDLSHNQLTSLPSSFHLLLHLRYLDLSHNRLRSVPDSLTRLPQLHTLNLANNAITELPASITRLSCLRKLNVSNNQLRALPGSLTELDELSVVVTLGNNLIHPPQAICDSGTEATLQYLRQRHSPPTPQLSAGKVGVFTRVRGQQVAASVGNPESASVEYRQAQGASRTSKRKCPLMPPASASSLSSDQLTDMLLGLFYGLVVGDAMGLGSEGLSADECAFHYNPCSLTLDDRVSDYLRAHFPPNDWSSSSDIVVLLLESVMRWGGVVDELEFSTRVKQWLSVGLDTLDPLPGHSLSPYTFRVINSDGYSANPHGAAQAVYTQVKEEHTRGIYTANPSDNSCLPSALILGVPNFYLNHEVEMNAERICRATHVDSLARATSTFVALLVAAFLQGKASDDCSTLPSLIHSLKEMVADQITDKHNKERFLAAFLVKGNETLKDCDPDDVLISINLIMKALESESLDFQQEVSRVVMRGGDGACSHASVVGGLVGALVGYSHLPQDWLSQLPQNNIKLINTKLNLLLDLFGLP